MKVKEIQDIKKFLISKKPIAIFLYMNGCPHCINMDPIWTELSNEMDFDFYKIESNNVPSELNIIGYPHYLFINNNFVNNTEIS